MEQDLLDFNDTTTLNFLLNSTTNGTEEVESAATEEDATQLVDILLIMLYCTIIASTVIGNTLVIAAVATTRRLRTVTNCFVMSLAVADWLVGMFVMPVKVVFHLSRNTWTLGWLVCKIWIALDVMLCTSSILSLCTISIDRYLSITRPLAYSRRRRSKRLALTMISFVWVGSIAITTPPMFKWLHSEQKRPDQCEYEDDPFYVVYSAMGSFFVPLLVMLYVYARIACVIARRQHNIQKLQKTKDKGDTGSEMMLTMNRTPSDAKSGKRHEKVTSTTSSASSSRRGQREPNPRIPSDFTYWNLLCCSRSKGKRWKEMEDLPQRKRLVLEEGQESSPNEIPNPNTLFSIGLGTAPTSDLDAVDHETAPDLEFGLTKTGNGTNKHGHSPRNLGHSRSGLRMTSRTGSRLCNHNITSSSPPGSTIPNLNVQLPSSSVTPRVTTFSKSELTNLLPPRVWTINDERHKGKEELMRMTQSAFMLDHESSRNCVEKRVLSEASQGRSSIEDFRSRPAHVAVHAYSTSPPNVGLRKHVGKVQSQSCSTLTGTTTRWSCPPSHVVRSRSVKVTTTQQLSDVQPAGPSKDIRPFTANRVSSFKKETKTAQTLTAVVGGFIICWLPFFVAYVSGPFIKADSISRHTMEYFVWLGWGNSAINPAIYAFYNPDFRTAFWRLTVHKCNGLLKVNGRKRENGSPRRQILQEQHLLKN